MRKPDRERGRYAGAGHNPRPEHIALARRAGFRMRSGRRAKLANRVVGGGYGLAVKLKFVRLDCSVTLRVEGVNVKRLAPTVTV